MALVLLEDRFVIWILEERIIMPQVSIPHQFFIDERKKLYNWKPDFWRELLQNSVDAGSRHIKIYITDCGGGQVRCSVEDDGCGMTRDVLERVYFALGGTTKSGSSIGGFGRARIMTCFGHDRYEIETLTNQVAGCGANYELYDIENQPGCIVRVWMSDTNVDEMKNILESYLKTCSFKLQSVYVSINDVPFRDYLDRGRRVRELSFAGIYVNRSGDFENRVIFRVGGLMMFSRYVHCDKQVVVEISPDCAREVLSANRNEFTDSAKKEIDSWIDELTVDNHSALRERNKETRRIINGSGSMVMKSSRPDIESSQLQGKSQSTAPIETFDSFKATVDIPNNCIAPNLFDVLIIDETGDPSKERIIERYNPLNWTHEIKNDRGLEIPYKKGREAYRLLMAYKIATEEALRVLLEVYGMDRISWSVGWVFNEWSEGCHLTIADCHIFCLNPLSGTKAKYRLTKKKDLLAILAIAKHEVAHARVDIHNEEWGSTLTQIDKGYDTQSVIRKIKTGLAALNV